VDSNSNSDDRCQRQKQGGAVGAARAAQGTMQPLGAATRVPFLRGSRHPPAPTKKPQRIKIRCGFVLGSLSERQPPALLVE